MAITELTGAGQVSSLLTQSLPTRGYHFNGKKVSPVRRTIWTWIAHGNHLTAITALTKHCANLSTSWTKLRSTDLLMTLSLQTTWLNKTVRGPRFQSLVLMGQGHQWLRQVAWQGVVWGLPLTCPPHCQGLCCWQRMLVAGGESPWPAPVVHAGQRGPAWRFSGRTLLQVIHFSLYP